MKLGEALQKRRNVSKDIEACQPMALGKKVMCFSTIDVRVAWGHGQAQ